jgi:hypothetical protein
MGPEQEAAGAGGDVRALRLSDGLKEAFAGLAGADLGPEDRQRWHRRLLAVTNLAKHDVGRAEARLDRLRDDLARDLGSAPSSAPEDP